MSRQIVTNAPDVVEAIKLLGPALVLSTESERDFDQMFNKLLACLKVEDEFEVLLVRDLAEASWELHRYSRLRGRSFERRFRQSLDFQVQRVKAQRARKQELIGTVAAQATTKPADIAEVTALEIKVQNSVTEVDEILNRTPTELDHAHSLEKSIAFHKDVEMVIASISRRRNEALHMLDFYRFGLGKRVDQTMKEIIEVEPQSIEE